MNTLEIDRPVTLDDQLQYSIVEVGAGQVRLRCLPTGAYSVMHSSELARRVVGMPPMNYASPRSFDVCTEGGRERALNWELHLRELETGIGLDGVTRRPEYDPATTRQEDRLALKREELLLHHGRSVSRATLMRKLKEYREKGPAGLIDGRSMRTRGPLDELDTRVLDALCTVMADQKLRSTGKKSRLISETHALLMRQYGDQRPDMPSPSSMYRYIDRLDGGRHTTGNARTRRSLANRPNRTFAKTGQLYPGAEVQIDSTKLALWVRMPDGEVKRPLLTIMVDVATRSIMAHTLRIDGTRGVDLALLLAQALTPRQNRPSRSVQRSRIQANTTHRLRTDEELALASNARPFVFPRSVTVDNGKDYKGETFTSALRLFGIDVIYSAPRTPTDKPIVERTFQTIETLFLQHFPGYAGNGPEMRGHKVEEEEGLLDFWTLHELLDDFILCEYQNRPHEGLRDRLYPSVTYSPNQMLSKAAELTSTIHLPLTQEAYIELMPTAFRVVDWTGIRLHSKEYDCDELMPLRKQVSNRPDKKGQWEVKYDPYDPTRVWLRNRDGSFITVPERTDGFEDFPYESELRPDRDQIARESTELAGVPVPSAPTPTSATSVWDFAEDEDDDEPLRDVRDHMEDQ